MVWHDLYIYSFDFWKLSFIYNNLSIELIFHHVFKD